VKNVQRVRVAVLFTFFVLVGLALAPNTRADPLFFSNVVALQNNDLTRIDLFSNPGVNLIGQQINFLVDITGVLPAGTTNTLMITYTAAGSSPIVLSYAIPLFGTVQPPLSVLFTIPSTGATTQGTPVTLTVDIIGSSPDFVIPGGANAGQLVDSFTYRFNVVEPIPEPATIFMMSTGLASLLLYRRRRKTSRGFQQHR
jgi:hypothetical protein